VNPFKGLPRFSKVVAGWVVFLYLVQLVFPATLHTLALTADFIFATPTSFIQLITSGFLEVRIISLVGNVASFLLLGKYLEPVWGTREFLRFIVLVNFVTTIYSYVSVIFAYMITGNVHLLYYYYWCGFSGITCALSVAIKQLDPERPIGISYLSVRAKFVPSLCVVGVIALSLIGFNLENLPFVVFGVYNGWFYLRFVQKRGEVVGDLNETFGFASFFPDFLAGPIAKLTHLSYQLFALCGLWQFFGVSTNRTTSSSSGDSSDAERRRKRAARALEKKLAETKSTDLPQTTTLSVEQLV